MIAYKQSDVKLSWMDNATVNNFPKVCGYVKEGAGNTSFNSKTNTFHSLNFMGLCCLYSELDVDPMKNDVVPISTKHSQTSFLPEYLFKPYIPKRGRHKRQADQYEYTPTKTRCPLLLVADYRFFQEMGSGNTKTTINYLVSATIFHKKKIQINMFQIDYHLSNLDKSDRSCAQNIQ